MPACDVDVAVEGVDAGIFGGVYFGVGEGGVAIW
jgi:hypothetical protein